jgi:hypothetical protein
MVGLGKMKPVEDANKRRPEHCARYTALVLSSHPQSNLQESSRNFPPRTPVIRT